MKHLSFSKLEANGNDFIAIDNRRLTYSLDELIEVCHALCHRKKGIGADGMLVLQPTQIKGLDFEMIYRNADGSNAGMCGNGGRAIAYFAHLSGMAKRLRFHVHQAVYTTIVSAQEKSVRLEWIDKEVKIMERIGNPTSQFYAHTGTEHEVLFFNDRLPSESEMRRMGKEIRYDASLHTEGTNVNFAVLRTDYIEACTYERGVEDLTLACGTGALAISMAAHWNKERIAGEFSYLIKMPGGELKTYFHYDANAQKYHRAALEGAVNRVFDGVWVA